MSSNESGRNFPIRLLLTLAMGVYLYSVLSDLRIRYEPVLRDGTAFPESLIAVSIFIIAFFAAVFFYIWRPAVFRPFILLRERLGIFRQVIPYAILLLPCWILLYTKWSEVFSGSSVRSALLFGALFLAAWLVTSAQEKLITWAGFLEASVLFGAIFMLSRAAQDILPYPFGMGWSEGNRWWDYSVLFGRHLYNYPADQEIPAFIDLGRQALWGIIFLIPNLPIWAARAWDAFLFTVPYALLGWATFGFDRERRKAVFLAGLWTMLFLNQGPIYTPLVICAILVLLARNAPLWLAFTLVFGASLIATQTRFTWTFAPGIWAFVTALAMKYNGQVDSEGKRWLRAILLGISGLLGGYLLSALLQSMSILSSGGFVGENALSTEGITSMISRQPLLWDRLWPNTTYPLGIIPGLCIAAAPLVILLTLFGFSGKWRLNIFQAGAVLGSLLAFLVVGVIVSVKIGGGSNLHNLDMFLIGLLFVAALAWEAGIIDWLFAAENQRWWKHLVVAFVVLIPAASVMLAAEPRSLPSSARTEAALDSIRTAIAEHENEGEILFIDQRQLLTFGNVPAIPLVPEYEKKRMMDMAMADDAAYFAPFIRDLYNHRFSAIISEPLWIQIQQDERIFDDENNAFVKWVSIPVLCYYEPFDTYEDVGIQILIPRRNPLDEPGVECPTP